jgi:hypothetical protein
MPNSSATPTGRERPPDPGDAIAHSTPTDEAPSSPPEPVPTVGLALTAAVLSCYAALNVFAGPVARAIGALLTWAERTTLAEAWPWS